MTFDDNMILSFILVLISFSLIMQISDVELAE